MLSRSSGEVDEDSYGKSVLRREDAVVILKKMTPTFLLLQKT